MDQNTLQKELDLTKRKIRNIDSEIRLLEEKRNDVLSEQEEIIKKVEEMGLIVDGGRIKRMCDYNPY